MPESVHRTRLAWEECGTPMVSRVAETPLWAVLTAVFVFLFGPWTTWWQVYLALVVLDYVTGFLAACKTGTTDSDRARSGIIRKVGSITAVAVAHQLDVFLGTSDLVRVILSAFIASEAWSCIENLDDCSVPFPESIREKVKALRANNPRKRQRKESLRSAKENREPDI